MSDQPSSPIPRVLVPRNRTQPTRGWVAATLLTIWTFLLSFFFSRPAQSTAPQITQQSVPDQIDPSEIRRLRMARFNLPTTSSEPDKPEEPSQKSEASPQEPKKDEKEKLTSKPTSSSSNPPKIPASVDKAIATKPVSTPVVAKPKLGPVLLRILQVSISSGSEASSTSKTSLRSSTTGRELLSLDYTPSNVEEGLQVFEIDEVLFAVREKLSSGEKNFDYLLEVFENLTKEYRRDFFEAIQRSVSAQLYLLMQEDPKFVWAYLKRMRDSCTISDVYGNDSALRPEHLEQLLKQIVQQFSLEELTDVLQKPVALLVDDLCAHASVESDFYPPLRVFQALFSIPKVKPILLAHPLWHVTSDPSSIANGTAYSMDRTILGSILAISTANRLDLKLQSFDRESLTPAALDSNRESMRSYTNRLAMAHSLMLRIIDYLVQDEYGWKHFLYWIGTSFNATPHMPSSMRYDLQWTQHRELQLMDGLYMNIMMATLHLTSKFRKTLHLSNSEIYRSLDLSFLEKNNFGFKFGDVTALLALDGQTEDEPSESSNSVSTELERFHSCLIASIHCFQLVYMPVMKRYDRFVKQFVEYYNKEVDLHNSNAPAAQLMPIQQQSKLFSYRISTINLSFTPLTNATLEFFEEIGLWLQQLGLSQSHLPNGAHHPNLKKFPAFLIDEMLHYLETSLNQMRPLPWLEQGPLASLSSTIIDTLIDIFSCPNVSNYHILTRCAQVFWSIYTPQPSPTPLRIATPNPASEFDRLVLPVLQYYIKIEKTGSRAAFYEKFPVRRYLGFLLRHPLAKAKIMELCVDAQVFKPFLTVLMNDNLFLLDESIVQLSKIQELRTKEQEILQREPKTPEDANTLRDVRSGLHEAQEFLKGLSQFGNNSFELFEVLSALSLESIVAHARNHLRQRPLTDSGAAPFTARVPVILDDQVLEQVSVMLNYFLEQFALPAKRQKLTLEAAAGNAFKPSQMVACLVLIYLNIDQACALLNALPSNLETAIDAHKFQNYVVRESRSFHIETFEEVVDYARTVRMFFEPTTVNSMRMSWKGRPSDETTPVANTASEALLTSLPSLQPDEIAYCVLTKWQIFMKDLKARALEAREEDIPDSEIPEHFLDALLATLMKDPVKLPSGHIVDRSTILRQLEGHDKSDPFTRVPLTIDQVIPDTDLQQEIKAWLAARKQKQAEASSAPNLD